MLMRLRWQVHGAQRSVHSARAVCGAGQGQGRCAAFAAVCVHSTAAHAVRPRRPAATTKRRCWTRTSARRWSAASPPPAAGAWASIEWRCSSPTPQTSRCLPLPPLAPAVVAQPPPPPVAGSAVFPRHEACGRTRPLNMRAAAALNVQTCRITMNPHRPVPAAARAVCCRWDAPVPHSVDC